MAWTEEDKALVIQKYKDAEPTSQNSMEIVKEIADEMDQSANGVRMILSQANVYIKKDGAKTASATTTSSDKAPRVSKEAAHARLTTAIEAAGQTADTEILSKLTGKAAIHFAEIIEAINA